MMSTISCIKIKLMSIDKLNIKYLADNMINTNCINNTCLFCIFWISKVWRFVSICDSIRCALRPSLFVSHVARKSLRGSVYLHAIFISFALSLSSSLSHCHIHTLTLSPPRQFQSCNFLFAFTKYYPSSNAYTPS